MAINSRGSITVFQIFLPALSEEPSPVRHVLAVRGGEGAASGGLNWEINSCSKEVVLAHQVINVALDTLTRNTLIYEVAGLPLGSSVALWSKRALCQLFIPVRRTPVLCD